jgi:hypothetical protein
MNEVAVGLRMIVECVALLSFWGGGDMDGKNNALWSGTVIH